MTRPRNFTIAAALQAVMSLLAIVLAIPLLAAGQAATDQAGASPPFIIMLLAFGTGALGLVSAYGVWKVQKWGVILTIVLRAIDALSAAPGLLFAPDMTWRLMAITGVALSILVIALLLWPQPKVAPAVGRAG
jgi:uncharacterized membrane protein (DUF2068 family)